MASNQIYLTTGPCPRQPDKLLAVVSKGSPQRGDKDVEILTLETFAKGTEYAKIKAWYDRVVVEQPWQKRH